MMKKRWMAVTLVIGASLWALSAPQAQRVQKPPVKKAIENIEVQKLPIGQITITNPTSLSGVWFAGYFGRNITWTKSGTQPDNVKIELRDAGCSGGILVIAESTPNDGLHYWTIPESLSAGTYTIRISGGSAHGCSAQFPIHRLPYKITVPAGTWKIGSAHTITWTSTQPASTLVRLGFQSSLDQSKKIVKYDIPNDGSEAITVPDDLYTTGTYKILLTAQYPDYGLLEIAGGGPITIIH
jgi:Kre9/KNH-like N-terminal Ig-like domain